MNKKYEKGAGHRRASVVPSKKKHLKRAVTAVVAAFAFLCVVALVLYGVKELLKKENARGDAPQSNLTSDGKNYINYYEPDYKTDIFADEDYLALNRTVKYVIPSETGSMSIVLDEYPKEALTEGQRFFLMYFDTVTGGDAAAYHALFTADYIRDPVGSETRPADREFPMQRLYDFTVTELGRTDPTDASYVYGGKQAVFGVYEVSYKILKNDGEFRYDLPEGGVIPLVFELVTTDAGTDKEQTLIKNLYKYSDIAD